MKISRVEVLCANRAVYAKVYTDNGLYGIGESGAWGLLAASGEAIKMFGEYLVGQDPLDIEHHWQYMYRFSHFRGAAVMGAISALDEALYDIAGKFYGVPVYRLLGGKCRDKVRVYNHTAGRTEEELIENAIKGKEEGFTALGHLNPYLDEPRNQPFHDNNTQMLYNAERRIARVREAVGEDTDLCLELHRRLEPGLAVLDVGGEILLVSQFTLLGDARHGRRPSFIAAARPEVAEPLLETMKAMLEEKGLHVETGRFRAHMDVELVNDGPVTILIDSRKVF